MNNQVLFIFEGRNITVQCKEDEIMEEIINSFARKANLSKNELDSLFFSYNGQAGNEFNKSLTFKEIANSEDKKRNQMNVLVEQIILNDKTEIKNKSFLIKSSYVKCPICKEISRLNFKNYKIIIFDCKNNHINNLSFEKFEKSQYIDLSKIICEDCKKINKKISHNNKFYKCLDCNINLCPLCKDKHDDINHKIINYDKINYICEIHENDYTEYCLQCHINICLDCHEDHSEHKYIHFSEIIPKKSEIKEIQMNVENIKNLIAQFNEDFKLILDSSETKNYFKEIFANFIDVVENNFKLFYEIKKSIIDNFNNNKSKNYSMIKNLKEINNFDDIIKDINLIINEKNIKIKLYNLVNIYIKINQNNFKEEIELEKSKKENEDLMLENDSLEKKIKVMNNKNNDLENKNKELENELKNINNKNKELENELKNINNKNKELENELKNINNKNKELENELKNINNKNKELENELKNMNNKNKELENELKNMNNKNKELENELKNINIKNKDVENKNEDLVNTLKFMNNENNALVNELKNKNNDLENNIKNIEEEIKIRKKEIDSQKLLLQNEQNEKKILENQFNELKEENKNLKKELENEKQNIEKLNYKINRLKEENEKLSGKTKNMIKDKINLEKDLKNFKTKNNTLESELKNIKKKNNDLEEEMGNIKKKNNDLEEEMGNIKKKNNDLEEEMGNIKKKNNDLEEKMENFDKEKRVLNKKLKENSSKMKMLEIKNSNLEKENAYKISDLENILKREKNKNKKLNDELIEIRKEKNKIEDKLYEKNDDLFSQTFSNFKRPSLTPYFRTFGDEKKYMNSTFSFNNICNLCGKDSQKLENENYTMKNVIQNLTNKNNSLIQENENLKQSKLKIEEQNKIMENKLSLIGKIIGKQVNEADNLSNLYNLGNKYLIIELIATNYITKEKVADVMFEIDRGNFTQNLPYLNRPIPIGFNVTISAPHMHAFALEWLSDFCCPYSYILDVGSGSGFLTLALSKMANDSATVVGIEHINELYNFGIENVNKNNSYLINNRKIIFIRGDGRQGYQIQKFNKAIYKAIHVGAASETMPTELIDQLACNGRMFIPIGKRGGDQFIYIIDKDINGEITFNRILQVNYGMLTDINTQINGY